MTNRSSLAAPSRPETETETDNFLPDSRDGETRMKVEILAKKIVRKNVFLLEIVHFNNIPNYLKYSNCRNPLQTKSPGLWST